MIRPAPSADAVDAVLPQTQCTRCGFPDCAAYAAAVSRRDAPINRCPPGGPDTIEALAALTGQPPSPLDPACGVHAPRAVAVVDEARCIGCTICIEACPVDAIVGAPKRMHAVIDALCSGCGLCVAPCPVDCIAMRPAGRPWSDADADAARARHRARAARLERGERIADRRAGAAPAPAGDPDRERRQAAVAMAMERARARRAKASAAP
ncbi:Ion-translocating oxidoreductase complex subunit B [Burkholderiales bacterium]|nr:Ion-translocating oxidoreductase complex subunit B [Burkholderiales bacterium]